MPSAARDKLSHIINHHPNIVTFDFTPHLLNYLQAADLVVSMAGYNIITEILSLGKKAVVVPRHQPSQEQLIRAVRMENLGLLTAIAPKELTGSSLSQAIIKQLNNKSMGSSFLNFDGLLNIQQEIISLLTSHNNIVFVTNRDKVNFYSVAI